MEHKARMISEPGHSLRLQKLTALTKLAVHHPFWFLVMALVLAVVSLGYTARHLSINTSTEDMLAENLEFRQRYTAFRDSLPALKNNIIIVIDGPTPELVDDAARRLSRHLAAMDTVFRDVFDPASDDFFRRHGLLFLNLEELDALSIRLAASQPLLAALAANPNLSGLLALFEDSLRYADQQEDDLNALSRVFDHFAAGAEGLHNGQTTEISWQNLLSGETISDQQTNNRRVILVKPSLDFSSLSPAKQAVETIRSAAQELAIDARHGLNLRLTGTPVIEQDELLSVRQGAAVSGVVSLVLVAFLTMTGLRSRRLIIATLISLILGLIWTAGYAAVTIGQLNIISVAFAVLFIGIGVDFGIQYCLRYRESLAQGLDNRQALIAAADGVGTALALAATAAAIGFLSFIPTDYIGLSELGQISAAGMAIALVTNFTILPCLLTIWPLRVAKSTQITLLWSDRLWRRYADFLTPQNGRRMTLAALVITGVAAVTGWQHFRFDYDPLNLKDPTTESYLTARDLQAADHSGYSISLLASSPSEAAVMSQRLRALPVVGQVRSPADYVPSDQEAKLALIDDMALYLAPALKISSQEISSQPEGSTADHRAALAAFLQRAQARLDAQNPQDTNQSLERLINALYPYLNSQDKEINALENVLLGHFAGQLDRLKNSLEAQSIALESLPLALKQRLITEDGRHLVRVLPGEDIRDLEALSRFVETVQAAFPAATGTPIVIYHAGKTVIDAFQTAAVISAIAICLLLFLVLGRLREAVLTAIPLLMALSLTASIAGLSMIQLNFANMIALPLIASLGVAYGLYIVLRSRTQRGIQAVLATSTPRAILFSALTTMGSFGSLALSPHRGTASMGLLMSIALTMVLVSSFTLLPALLAWRQGCRERQGSTSQRSKDQRAKLK